MSYDHALFYSPSSYVLARGFADLIVANSEVFAEVGAEQNLTLPIIGTTDIFVGTVSKEAPKLITITHSWDSRIQANSLLRNVELGCVIRAGSEGSPEQQSNRSAGYAESLERIILGLIVGRRFKSLIDWWPTQKTGESAGDYAARKALFHKNVGIALNNQTATPSNEAQRAISGYEGGLLLRLTLQCGVRQQ